MLTSNEKRQLKAIASTLDTKYQVGKNEISDTVVAMLDKALTARELIKIDVMKSVEVPVMELALDLSSRLNAEIVQVVGRVIVLYRFNKHNHKIKLTKQMNRIIFGGAFDPIHNGHINMALKAQKALDGEIIFVPARISVWKSVSAPIEDKIAMLELAIEGQKHLSIDLFEINSGKDVNYSIDTIRYFKNKYPNDKLYYLIGNDQVNEFHRWKEADKIAEIVDLVFYTRPGYEINQENVKRFKMTQIDGDGIEVSSTKIRELKDFNLPPKVLFYIVEHDLYEGMVELNKILTPHRLAHSKSVAKTAYEIAVANNVKEPLKTFVAGLFHDIGKDIPIEKQEELTKKAFPEFGDQPKWAYHQFAGAVLAESMFGIKDQSILDAIKFHSTGNENMDYLAKIIYASDKIEPTRGFDSSDLIQAMKNDIDEGFKIVLQANKDYLIEHVKSIENPLTFKCFKQYLQ